MKCRYDLTAQELRERLNYDPETGIFFWRKTTRQGFIGKKAGYIDDRGYIVIVIDAIARKAHRLAVLYMTGNWPKEKVDHRNLNKSDNRWTNLREATASQNQANSRMYVCNMNGAKGITKRSNGRYRVQIRKDYKLNNIGTFDTIEEAKAAHTAAHVDAFGDFSRS